MPALVSALNSVDLPTLGKPTMPHWRLMESFELVKRRAPRGSTLVFARRGRKGPATRAQRAATSCGAGQTAIVSPRLSLLGEPGRADPRGAGSENLYPSLRPRRAARPHGCRRRPLAETPGCTSNREIPRRL